MCKVLNKMFANIRRNYGHFCCPYHRNKFLCICHYIVKMLFKRYLNIMFESRKRVRIYSFQMYKYLAFAGNKLLFVCLKNVNICFVWCLYPKSKFWHITSLEYLMFRPKKQRQKPTAPVQFMWGVFFRLFQN